MVRVVFISLYQTVPCNKAASCEHLGAYRPRGPEAGGLYLWGVGARDLQTGDRHQKNLVGKYAVYFHDLFSRSCVHHCV